MGECVANVLFSIINFLRKSVKTNKTEIIVVFDGKQHYVISEKGNNKKLVEAKYVEVNCKGKALSDIDAKCISMIASKSK